MGRLVGVYLGLAALSAATLAGCGASAHPQGSSPSQSTAAAGTSSQPPLKATSTCVAAPPSIPSLPTSATQIGGTQHPVQLIHGNVLAEVFTAQAPFTSVGVQSPTWFTTGSGYTLQLLVGAGTTGKVVNCSLVTSAVDNQWNEILLASQVPAGTYTLTMAHPTGTAQEACPGHTTVVNCAGTPLSGKHGGVIGWYENTSGATANQYAIIGGKETSGVFALFYH